MKSEENASWQYKPTDDGADPEAIDETEPGDEKKLSKRHRQTVGWTASEYIDHRQGPIWFIALALISLALSTGIWFLTKDYFAAAVVVVVGAIVGVFARRTPKTLSYELSAEGLKVEQKVYPYGLFKSFSLVQDGPLLSLSLMPIKKFMPPVSVYFDPADQTKILTVLEDHLPYEETKLDAVERMTRRLRF